MARGLRAAARRARLVPDAAVRGDRLGGVHAARSRCRTGRSTRRSRPSPWFNFQLDLVRCLWAVLPAAILWGASFPLALASVAARGPGSGAAGRRRLRRQHRRRDRRRARPRACCSSPGSAASARAAADRRRRRCRRCWCSRPRRPRTDDGAAARPFAGTIPIIVAAVCAALLARTVPRDSADARRLRPLRRDADRPGRRHLRGRGLERVGRRHARCRAAS